METVAVNAWEVAIVRSLLFVMLWRVVHGRARKEKLVSVRFLGRCFRIFFGLCSSCSCGLLDAFYHLVPLSALLQSLCYILLVAASPPLGFRIHRISLTAFSNGLKHTLPPFTHSCFVTRWPGSYRS